LRSFRLPAIERRRGWHRAISPLEEVKTKLRRVFIAWQQKRFRTSTSNAPIGGEELKARLITLLLLACVLSYYLQATFISVGFHEGGF